MNRRSWRRNVPWCSRGTCAVLLLAVSSLNSTRAEAPAPETPEAAAAAAAGTPAGAAAIQQAAALVQAGRGPEAMFLLANVLDAAQQAGDWRLQAQARVVLSAAHTLMGRPATAQATAQALLEEAQARGDDAIAAAAANNLGLALMAERQPRQALEAFALGMEHAGRSQDAALLAQCAINSAMAAAQARRPAEAVGFCRTAIDAARRDDNSTRRAAVLIVAGRVLGDLREAGPVRDAALLALDALRDAMALAETLADDALRAAAAYQMGRLYAAHQRHEEALLLTQQALLAAQRAQRPARLYQCQWQLARLHRDTGRKDQAIQAYQQAIATLQTVRGEVAAGASNMTIGFSFREQVAPLYYELADLLLRRAAAAATTEQAAADLRHARATIELFKTAELADYFRSDCINLQAQVTVDEVDPGTAVLYIIPLADRTELLVTISGAIRQYTVPRTAAELDAEVLAFRRQLENRSHRRFLHHAWTLHDWLIKPIEQDLDQARIQTLVIVPDGALRLIPLAALHDRERYLVEKYATVVSPGMTLTDSRRTRRRGVSALFGGLSVARHGYPSLPYVRQELREAADTFRPLVLMDDSFVESRLREAVEARDFDIIHLATHGEFAADASDCFILLYEQRLTLDGIERLLKPKQFSDHPIELLTLSACQTAAGDDRSALGLAGVSLRAGARSVVATLWAVNDQAAAALLGEFYARLNKSPEQTKAAALQQAQLELLRDIRFAHPCYWSPFLIVGNWL